VGKGLYCIVGVLLALVIFGTQTSNELTGYFKPYSVANSNEIFTISVNGSSYYQGQTIYFLGKVNHPDEGGKVDIQIIDPFKNTVTSFTSLLDRSGIFISSFPIPVSFQNGKYTIDVYYENDPGAKHISLQVNISNIPGSVSYIVIPNGASQQGNNLNFEPPTVTVMQGANVVWINNDATLHTVISGKVNDDGSFSLDNLFSSGYLSPGEKLAISLHPGKYSYFCQIHPWLGGTITVEGPSAKTPPKPSTPAKTILKSVTTPPKSIVKPAPFHVSDNILTTIWIEREDLQKAYPEVAKGNLTGLKKWAETKGWNEDKRLSKLIPQGKVPLYLDNALVSIWREREDLQDAYPEVAKGELAGLKKWAETKGWNEDKRLSKLIPQGKSPTYVISKP
jgi:plastocyanin